jgi:FtsH-binding integral membrane protein
MIASVIYALCAAASLACAVLLFRGWRASRVRLLLWGTLCFTGLTLQNILLVVDMRLAAVDLALLRLVPALLGVCVLLYGLIRDER